MMRIEKYSYSLRILKMYARAGWKVSAGQMWPAGRTLPTPALGGRARMFS